MAVRAYWLSAGFRFRKKMLAGTRRNERDAPIPIIWFVTEAFAAATDGGLASAHVTKGSNSDSSGTRRPSFSLFSTPIEVATIATSTLSCGVNCRMKSA